MGVKGKCYAALWSNPQKNLAYIQIGRNFIDLFIVIGILYFYFCPSLEFLSSPELPRPLHNDSLRNNARPVLYAATPLVFVTFHDKLKK